MIEKITTRLDLRAQKERYLCECGYVFTVSQVITNGFYLNPSSRERFLEERCPECGALFSDIVPSDQEIVEYEERKKYQKYSPAEMMAEIKSKLEE